ncbi:MAG: hypothetical protein H6Q74_319 [Firmicutes bacterium]|nr:hypothetical protein [Bacillota bacterium]
MWPAMYNCTAVVLAVIFCAVAVKLTDDYLDIEYDIACHKFNLARYFGSGTVIYAMLFLAVAASFNATVSLMLFMASYAVGMFSDLNTRMPSGLLGWQESILVIIVSVIIYGWQLSGFSLLIIFAVQCLDDCIDLRPDCDNVSGTRNLACRLGVVECGLLGIISVLAAWHIEDSLFLPVIFGIAVVYGVLFWLQEVKP